MKRRVFLRAARLGGTATVARKGVASPMPRAQSSAGTSPQPAKSSGMKIARIRFYPNPQSPPAFNQSFHMATVETVQETADVSEGGSPDTIKHCAAMLIGKDPAQLCFVLML